MLTWFLSFLGRIAGGERLEPAQRSDYRTWFALLFLLPTMTILWVRLGAFPQSSLSAIRVWLSFFIFALVFLFVWAFWARFVPGLVSLCLAIVVWAAAFWMAWHGKLGF
jgi:hypothetical protein